MKQQTHTARIPSREAISEFILVNRIHEGELRELFEQELKVEPYLTDRNLDTAYARVLNKCPSQEIIRSAEYDGVLAAS